MVLNEYANVYELFTISRQMVNMEVDAFWNKQTRWPTCVSLVKKLGNGSTYVVSQRLIAGSFQANITPPPLVNRYC